MILMIPPQTKQMAPLFTQTIPPQAKQRAPLFSQTSKSLSYPVDITDRYHLLFSSLFFFIPAIQAFSQGIYFLGSISLITGLASIQLWWFGLPDWRLSLDKAVAYSTTVCYISQGFLHVVYDDIQGNVLYPILYVFFCLSAARAYSLSCHKWDRGEKMWVIYHMFFHLFLSCGKYVVIDICSRKS